MEYWEVKPKGSQDWYSALGLILNRDGTFETNVWMPDGSAGWKLIALPAVSKEQIRDRANKRALEMPIREVVLTVPKEKPIEHTTLVLLDGASEEEFTHFFARLT